MHENAVGDAQPAHEGVLRRRGIEQAVEAPAEVVEALGELPGGRVRLEPGIGVERVLVALGLLLGGELLALGLDAGHRLQMRRIRAGWLAAADRAQRLQAGGGPRRLHARHEALEIALLRVGEVLATHHAASANASPNASASRIGPMGRRERISSAYQSASCVSPTSTAPVSRPSRTTSLR